jgi:HEAT repeat protein
MKCGPPLHAWRALGQLGDPAAVEAIVSLLPRIDGEYNSDWEQEELPLVLGMIGSPAIPTLEAFLANPQHGLYARAAAATALGKIGQEDTAVREECIAVPAKRAK